MTGSFPWKSSDGKLLTIVPVKDGDFTGWLKTITTREGMIKSREELQQKIAELKAIAERVEELKSKFSQLRAQIRK